MHAVDALLETFTWAGFAAGILFLLVALIVRLTDGSWVPTRILIEDDDHGRVARWFGADGGVGTAHLSHEQDAVLAGRDEAEAYTRAGTSDRFRLERSSPAARAFSILGVVLIGVGAASVIVSLVLMFVRG